MYEWNAIKSIKSIAIPKPIIIAIPFHVIYYTNSYCFEFWSCALFNEIKSLSTHPLRLLLHLHFYRTIPLLTIDGQPMRLATDAETILLFIFPIPHGFDTVCVLYALGQMEILYENEYIISTVKVIVNSSVSVVLYVVVLQAHTHTHMQNRITTIFTITYG